MQEDEVMKCPICESGFVEEILEDMHMAAGADHQDHIHIHENENENENENGNGNSNSSDGALSLWAPILLGMIANPIRLHQRSLMDNDDGGSGDADDDNDDEQAVVRRRRRRRSSAAAVLQLLQSIRAGMVLDHQHQHQHHHHHHQEQAEQGQGQGGVIFINPFINQITTSIPSSSSSSLGDYFIGPGLDLLLQHLSENDPNRYGTPPTHKDALDALPTLTIQEDEAEADAIQCAVCLDECEVGSQVKEMPCKHKFHTNCILPWLQLHSSCPVCRYQLPTDDSKLLSHPSSSSSSTANHNHDNDNDDNNNNNNNNGPGIRRFSVPLLWPFTTLFSSSTSQPTTPSLITHPASTDAAPPTADNDTSA